MVQHEQPIRRYVEFNAVAPRLPSALCVPETAVDHVSVGIEASNTNCLLANSDATVVIYKGVRDATRVNEGVSRRRDEVKREFEKKAPVNWAKSSAAFRPVGVL
jgi:hypothetical protein